MCKKIYSVLYISISFLRKIIKIVFSINPKLIKLIFSSSAILSFTPSSNISIYRIYTLICSHYHTRVVIYSFISWAKLKIKIGLFFYFSFFISANRNFPSSVIIIISFINTYTLFTLNILEFRSRIIKSYTFYTMVSSFKRNNCILVVRMFVSKSAFVSLIRTNSKKTYKLIVVLIFSSLYKSLKESESGILINCNSSSCFILSYN